MRFASIESPQLARTTRGKTRGSGVHAAGLPVVCAARSTISTVAAFDRPPDSSFNQQQTTKVDANLRAVKLAEITTVCRTPDTASKSSRMTPALPS